MNNGLLLGGCAALVVSCAARGDFYICCVDFGGPWIGVNGSPLVPVGGSIIALGNTDPSFHNGASEAFGGASGWGTTVGGMMDEAPAGIPGDPALGSFHADGLVRVYPGSGIGAAEASFFGGYYGGNDVHPAFAAVILAADNDAWIARIRLTGGATLATSGPVYVAVQGLSDPHESVLGIDETGVVDITYDYRVENKGFRLEYREVANLFTDGSVVYDVFVVETSFGGGGPGPGPRPGPRPDPGPNPLPSPLPGPAPDRVPGMPDFNNDGSVDQDDLRYMLLAYGPTQGSSGRMDFDSDGFIDGTDFSEWLDLYRSSRTLDKAEKKAVKNTKKTAKQIAKKTVQRDKKVGTVERLQAQLIGETGAKRRNKLSLKVTNLSLAINRLQSKIGDIIESAAARM